MAYIIKRPVNKYYIPLSDRLQNQLDNEYNHKPTAHQNCDGSVVISAAAIKAITKRRPEEDFYMNVNGKRVKVRVFSNCAP